MNSTTLINMSETAYEHMASFVNNALDSTQHYTETFVVFVPVILVILVVALLFYLLSKIVGWSTFPAIWLVFLALATRVLVVYDWYLLGVVSLLVVVFMRFLSWLRVVAYTLILTATMLWSVVLTNAYIGSNEVPLIYYHQLMLQTAGILSILSILLFEAFLHPWVAFQMLYTAAISFLITRGLLSFVTQGQTLDQPASPVLPSFSDFMYDALKSLLSSQPMSVLVVGTLSITILVTWFIIYIMRRQVTWFGEQEMNPAAQAAQIGPVLPGAGHNLQGALPRDMDPLDVVNVGLYAPIAHEYRLQPSYNVPFINAWAIWVRSFGAYDEDFDNPTTADFFRRKLRTEWTTRNFDPLLIAQHLDRVVANALVGPSHYVRTRSLRYSKPKFIVQLLHAVPSLQRQPWCQIVEMLPCFVLRALCSALANKPKN